MSSVFSILFVVVLPPVQLAAVLIPTLIALGVSGLVREGVSDHGPRVTSV